jgi:hypothetical protein
MTTNIKTNLRVTYSVPTKPLSRFALGDFLLPIEDGKPNGAIGIKVGPNSIRWIRSYSGDSGSITDCVETEHPYGVPTSVTIEAVL